MKLIFLGLLILCILYVICVILIEKVKDRARKEGYEEAVFDVTAAMVDKAYWFSGCSKITYNVLYLFATTYRRCGTVNASVYRDKILKLDHSKRITDLSKREFEEITGA